MHQHYTDITDKLGEPQWYDECGVPRYCDFHPSRVNNIYANEVVLLEIVCQNCGQLFQAAMTQDSFDIISGRSTSLAEQVINQTIHYGDPPNSGCCPVGATMNSIPLWVIEYWQRGAIMQWERVSEYEVEIVNEAYQTSL